MTEQEIFSAFAQIVAEVTSTPASAVTRETDLADDLDVSSLLLVEIIAATEDEFSVEIPDEALKDLRTVQDVVTYVRGAQPAGVGVGLPGDPEVATT